MGIKYYVDEKFFEIWSPEMAYVLGYLYADGSLEDASYLRGKYVRVSSTDKTSIVLIRKLLKAKHPIVLRERGRPYQLQYQLRIGSHKIYNDLIAHGLYPNKSLTVQFPAVPKRYFCHFLRGYFDGDGCVFLEFGRGITKKRIIKKLSVIFTSGSKLFLEQLGLYLDSYILKKRHRLYNGDRSFQLRYFTHDSIVLFAFLYAHVPKGLYLRRKLRIFIKYFMLRKCKIDDTISKTLTSLGYCVIDQ